MHIQMLNEYELSSFAFQLQSIPSAMKRWLRMDTVFGDFLLFFLPVIPQRMYPSIIAEPVGPQSEESGQEK